MVLDTSNNTLCHTSKSSALCQFSLWSLANLVPCLFVGNFHSRILQISKLMQDIPADAAHTPENRKPVPEDAEALLASAEPAPVPSPTTPVPAMRRLSGSVLFASDPESEEMPSAAKLAKTAAKSTAKPSSAASSKTEPKQMKRPAAALLPPAKKPAVADNVATSGEDAEEEAPTNDEEAPVWKAPYVEIARKALI